MSEEISVDLEALERAADGVVGTLEALAARKVSDLDPPIEAFGHERLGETVRDFCERWQIGVGPSGRGRPGDRGAPVHVGRGLSRRRRGRW